MSSGLSRKELTDLCQVFQSFPGIRDVVVFGSRAKGTAKPGSDVDLAVKGASDSEIIRLSASLNEETTLPYFFDVVAFETITSHELREHIERVGVLIYSSANL
jgi:predicted nucleotidyltransferase